MNRLSLRTKEGENGGIINIPLPDSTSNILSSRYTNNSLITPCPHQVICTAQIYMAKQRSSFKKVG